MKTIFLDIETADWFDSPRLLHLPRNEQIGHMPFGLAVTITPNRDVRRWSDANALITYLDNATVVSWNGDAFDIPIIERTARRQSSGIQSLDLYAAIRNITGRSYKLESVAIANGLGKKIAADGQAAKWIASGEKELIEQAYNHCEQDVFLLMRISARLHTTGLLLPARPQRDEYTALHVRYDGRELEVRTC